MELSMKESSKRINQMAVGLTTGLTGENIKVNGKKEKFMEWERSYGLKKRLIMVNMNTI